PEPRLRPRGVVGGGYCRLDSSFETPLVCQAAVRRRVCTAARYGGAEITASLCPDGAPARSAGANDVDQAVRTALKQCSGSYRLVRVVRGSPTCGRQCAAACS